MPDKTDFSRTQSESAALRQAVAEKLAGRRLLHRMSTPQLGHLIHKVESRARDGERWALLLMHMVRAELQARESGNLADDHR